MMLFKLQKNNNPEMKEAYGNYYALPVILQTMGIAELAVMMAEHNTGFSAGQVKGMLTDMVKCIKQLVLDGKAVKIDDLAIFTLGIVNKAGAATKAEFSVQKNIESVKLRARATGELTRAKLNLDASLKDIEKMVSATSDKDGDGGTPLKPGAGSTDQKDNTQETLFALPCQAFTSSHNTYLMTNELLRPDCNFILQDNKIKPLSECTDKELRLGHNIEKMFRGNAFEI